jgi:hypothetical protein
MKNKRAFSNKGTTSNFYCTKCGKKGIPVFRTGRVREAGHLKSMYCIYCGRTQNFAEIRPFGAYNFEDFKIEYEYGNFDNFGNRINSSYRNFIASVVDGKVEKVKELKEDE